MSKFPSLEVFICEYSDLYQSPKKAFRAVRKIAKKEHTAALNIKSVWGSSDFIRKKSQAALELKT